LSKLLIVPEAIAEDALADTLNGLVAIVQGSGEVIPSRTFESLDVPKKVLGYLLALRAAVILNNRATATATAEEIATSLHLDVQRTREALSRLKKRFVTRRAQG